VNEIKLNAISIKKDELEESVASKANNTRARVDTKGAVVVFCTEKSAENDDEFILSHRKNEMR